MPDSDIAVSTRGLSKSYTIVHDDEKHVTLAETLLSRVKNPFKRPKKETFWALKDVSFDIKKGEVVGIIGRNGAGKSTLLKILSRITEPTTGQIELFGRVGSLLEVGTGFHPELSGRENVYLNGAILGMAKSEIRRQFDAIVDFAGVEKFLDTPVKRYSSGMYVRLAFAVAAHLSSDILIVDEVLAVGDSEFQKKCLGKMKDVTSTEGKTVLFVSHNMAAITALCDNCVLLAAGKVVLAADTRTVTARYLNESESTGRAVFDASKNAASALVITACTVSGSGGEKLGSIPVTSEITIRTDILCRRPVTGDIEVSLRIFNVEGQPVFTTNFSDTFKSPRSFDIGSHALDVIIPAQFLVPGRYTISPAIHRPWIETFDAHDHAPTFEVEELGSSMARYHGNSYGMVLVNFSWSRVG